MASDPTQNIVVDALRKHQEGVREDLDDLLCILKSPNTEDIKLESYFRQFKDAALLLGKDFDAEVGLLLKLKWLERGKAVQEEYKSFILALLSAHTVYLKSSLRMIVKQFFPPIGSDEGEITSESRKLREAEFSQLHSLLSAILHMVPMTPTILLPLLSDNFPFMNKSSFIHECYMMNLIHITRYLPQHRNAVLIILIDRMAKLDVRAPRTEIMALDEDSDNEDEGADVFDMDDIGEEVIKVQDSLPPEQSGKPMAHGVADRLDVLMEVFLGYIHSVCYPNGDLDWAATKKLYRELLQDFDQVILPTHALHHTQFVMFYICSFREELTLGFIDYLWKKVYSPSTQVIFRQTAICYIGSLLARAKYTKIGLVTSTLDVIMEWLHKYAKHAAYTSSKADVRRHGTFYAVLQAVLYVLVFRHKELLNTPKGLKYIQGMNLQTLVSCRLNPLKFCLPIIVKTFASIMRQRQLLFCDTIIERNRRHDLSVEGSQANQGVNPLDSFFPFDPYILKRSSRFFKDIYREYEGTPTAEEESQKDDEEKMEEEIFGATPGSVPMSPTSATDFMMFGTSPGFKNL